jgi:hypothetical protein
MQGFHHVPWLDVRISSTPEALLLQRLSALLSSLFFNDLNQSHTKMASTITGTATVTGTDFSSDPPTKRLARSNSHANLNGFSTPQPLAPIRTQMKKKYRHVAAVHAKPRTSCLSHDSETAPSFLGFRNLMVIVLSPSTPPWLKPRN